MMRRRSKLRRVLKWTGLVVCVLIVAAWCVSAIWAVAYVRGFRGGERLEIASALIITSGAAKVHLGRAPSPRPSGIGVDGFADWAVQRRPQRLSGMYWLPTWYEGARLTLVIIPLWMPLAAVGVPTVFLWYRRRRRRREGHCQACGYNLTGLPEPRCPECGRPFTRRSP